MKNKGLCSTCNADKACVFQRRFPVLECEEFNDFTNHKYAVKIKPKRANFSEEATEAE
ncbi:MAG: hypothetical protein WC321_02985 [Candidatus Omnitrophota bacterium]|jgi:hypothetical protein